MPRKPKRTYTRRIRPIEVVVLLILLGGAGAVLGFMAWYEEKQKHPYPAELERVMDAAASDGEISDSESATVARKAESLQLDKDEVIVVLGARAAKKKRAQSSFFGFLEQD